MHAQFDQITAATVKGICPQELTYEPLETARLGRFKATVANRMTSWSDGNVQWTDHVLECRGVITLETVKEENGSFKISREHVNLRPKRMIVAPPSIGRAQYHLDWAKR